MATTTIRATRRRSSTTRRRASGGGLPARTYTRTETLGDGTRADFFFLDTSPFIEQYRFSAKVRVDGQDRAAQLRWLERALAASTAGWKIVFGHHQLFTVTGQHHDFPEMIGQFKPLFDRYGVRAYINGHEHNLEHRVVDGMHYITCGAGSRTSPVAPAAAGEFAIERHGFMTVELGAEALRFACVDEAGATLYQAEIGRTA